MTGLGATRRARMHQRVAEALEELYGADPAEHFGELALHWRLAAVSVEKAKAADYALKAGQRALENLAPAEAVKYFADAVEQTGGADSRERCEALIGLGEAQRQTGIAAFRDTLLEASRHRLGAGRRGARGSGRAGKQPGLHERDRRARRGAACSNRSRDRARRASKPRTPRPATRARGDGAELGPGLCATQSAR